MRRHHARLRFATVGGRRQCRGRQRLCGDRGRCRVRAGAVAGTVGQPAAPCAGQGNLGARLRRVVAVECTGAAGAAHRVLRRGDPRNTRHGRPRDAAGRPGQHGAGQHALRRSAELQRGTACRVGARRPFGPSRGRPAQDLRRAGRRRRDPAAGQRHPCRDPARATGVRHVRADSADDGRRARRDHAPLPHPTRQHHGDDATVVHADERCGRSGYLDRVAERTGRAQSAACDGKRAGQPLLFRSRAPLGRRHRRHWLRAGPLCDRLGLCHAVGPHDVTRTRPQLQPAPRAVRRCREPRSQLSLRRRCAQRHAADGFGARGARHRLAREPDRHHGLLQRLVVLGLQLPRNAALHGVAVGADRGADRGRRSRSGPASGGRHYRSRWPGARAGAGAARRADDGRWRLHAAARSERRQHDRTRDRRRTGRSRGAAGAAVCRRRAAS